MNIKKSKKKDIRNPIISALYEYVDEFELKFANTIETFKNAKQSTSDRKEEMVKMFLSSFFPDTYKITRGEIFDNKSISNSIDCVIKTPNHPSLQTPMRPEIILAEGVYAAVEVKPDISNLSRKNPKSEINRALKQCKSVKKLIRNIKSPRIDKSDDSYKTIPFVIFSKKSKSAEETVEYIAEKVDNKELNLNEIPDIILSLEGWIIYYTKNIKTSLFYNDVKNENDDENNSNTFVVLKGENNDLLCMFILMLYKFSGPEYTLNDFIIKKYLLDAYNQKILNIRKSIGTFHVDKR